MFNSYVYAFLVALWPLGLWLLLRVFGRVLRRRQQRVMKGTVVITGASTGIGRDVALALAGKGYLVFCGVRKQGDAESIKKEANGASNLRPILLDVTSDASVDEAAQVVAAEAAGGVVNVLINNAGVIYTSPVEFHDVAEFEKVLDVNVVGTLRVTKKFLPLLRRAERGTGRIINIGSLNGLVATPFRSAYCASKFALEAFNDSLRRELAPWDIFVAMINPGYIRTSIIEKNLKGSEHLKKSTHYTQGHAEHYYGKFYSEENVEATRNAVVKQAATTQVCIDAVLDILHSNYPPYHTAVGPRVLAAKLTSTVLPEWIADINMAIEMWPQHYKVNTGPPPS